MSTSDKSEAFYKKLKIQLQDTTLWPSEYLYKFIVTTNTTKIKKLSEDKGLSYSQALTEFRTSNSSEYNQAYGV